MTELHNALVKLLETQDCEWTISEDGKGLSLSVFYPTQLPAAE